MLIQRDALENETTFTYDIMSRVASRIAEDPDGAGGPLSSPVTTYSWTDAGELESVTDAIGRISSWERDLLGRVVTTTLPDTDGAGGAPAPQTHAAYDVLSRVVSETDALGSVVTFQWDDLSRLVERVDSDVDGPGPLGSPTTPFVYDLVGNVTSLTDSVGNTTSWVRDNLYRVTSETNELADSRTWQYDPVGNVVSQTDRNGAVIERDFDGLNRLVEERWKTGQTTVNTLTFGYDIASQLGTASDGFSGYAWVYDGLGRVTQTDNSPTPNTANVVLTQTWDAASRRTGLSASIDGTADFSNTYQFDALSRMTRIQQTDGAPSAGYTVSAKRVDLAYTQTGEFSTISRYADTAATKLVATSTWGYDDAGRLTSLVHAKGANTLASYSWVFDAQGRITSATSNDGTTTYSYDTTDQLTAADHSYQTDESYSYDLNGNRTNTGYVTGTNNRLLADATYDYTYDAEGNRTRRTNRATGAYEEYTWDHRNRLTSVTFKSSAGVTTKKVHYDYDVFDRLISRRVDSNGDGTFDSGQRFVYDQAPDKGGLSDIVLVFDDSGSLTHRYLPGPAIDQVFADENALGEVLWGLTDHQNTVRDVAAYNAGTDTTIVVNHLRYDSFGNITSQTSGALQPLLAWTGRYRDMDTGLQWNLHRWYDSGIGRWISEDPIGFAAGDANLGRYVGSSPLNFVDPSGLMGVGHHWIPVSVLTDPEIRRRLTAAAYQLAMGAYSGQTHPNHGFGQWGGVQHHRYNSLVRKNLLAYMDEHNLKRMSQAHMEKFANLIKNGRRYDGRIDKELKAFNDAVRKARADYEKRMARAGSRPKAPPDTADAMRDGGKTYLKSSRFFNSAVAKSLIGGLSAAVSQATGGLEAAASDQGRYYLGRAYEALHEGNLQGAEKALFGDNEGGVGAFIGVLNDGGAGAGGLVFRQHYYAAMRRAQESVRRAMSTP